MCRFYIWSTSQTSIIYFTDFSSPWYCTYSLGLPCIMSDNNVFLNAGVFSGLICSCITCANATVLRLVFDLWYLRTMFLAGLEKCHEDLCMVLITNLTHLTNFTWPLHHSFSFWPFLCNVWWQRHPKFTPVLLCVEYESIPAAWKCSIIYKPR